MNKLPNKLFRRSAVLALLFALLFCIGCNTVTTPNGTSETYGNRLMLATNNTAFYYDGILYWLKDTETISHKLYCIDVSTGEAMPLCGKPECSHDSVSCNAYIDSDGRGLVVYGEKLYWISNFSPAMYLWCSDLDGGNRQKVMELDKETENLTSDSKFMGIYDGKLFRCGCGSLVNEGNPIKSMLLYSQPLQSGSEPTRLYYAENVLRVFSRMSGNKLYFAIIRSDFGLELCVCDMDSGEVEVLYSDSNSEYDAQDLLAIDDRLILHGSGIAVYVYSITDGSLTTIGKEGCEYDYVTDSKLYDIASRGYYRLYDMDGELISDGAIDPPGFADGNYYTHYIGCVDDTMYFMFLVYPQSNGQISLSPPQESIAAFNTETLEWSLVFDDRE